MTASGASITSVCSRYNVNSQIFTVTNDVKCECKVTFVILPSLLNDFYIGHGAITKQCPFIAMITGA